MIDFKHVAGDTFERILFQDDSAYALVTQQAVPIHPFIHLNGPLFAEYLKIYPAEHDEETLRPANDEQALELLCRVYALIACWFSVNGVSIGLVQFAHVVVGHPHCFVNFLRALNIRVEFSAYQLISLTNRFLIGAAFSSGHQQRSR